MCFCIPEELLRTLPQLFHKHLNITLVEFCRRETSGWQPCLWCHPQRHPIPNVLSSPSVIPIITVILNLIIIPIPNLTVNPWFILNIILIVVSNLIPIPNPTVTPILNIILISIPKPIPKPTIIPIPQLILPIPTPDLVAIITPVPIPIPPSSSVGWTLRR